MIKIATKNSASSLGILDKVGTIETGKQVDIVILNKDPTRNISNTRLIETVIEDGKLINSSLIGY